MTLITETEEVNGSVGTAGIRGSTKTTENTAKDTMEDMAVQKRSVREPLWETMEETVVETMEEAMEETVEEAMEETVEEAMEETVEETMKGTVAERHKGRIRESVFRPKISSQTVAQRSHLKKLFEWLLPYLIAMVLVIGIGEVVLLASDFRTRHLNKQLQEQYGEYFADE